MHINPFQHLVYQTCVAKAFAFWKGDMEAHCLSHLCKRNYRCNQICDFCLCTSQKSVPELSWGDLSMRALLRHTLTLAPDPHDCSPWVAVPHYEKSKRLLDLLHLVHLGTLRDLVASAIVDALEDNTLAEFYGLRGCLYNVILHRFSYHFSVWSKDRDMSLYIGTLTMARLNRPDSKVYPYAELDSRIKASKVRTLFAFVTMVMVRLAFSPVLDTDAKRLHARVRATCCWALDISLSCWNLCPKVRMAESHVKENVWYCRLHSARYQYLAGQCIVQKRLLYKCRPKAHYFTHMVDHFLATRLNLMHLSTFMDEDFMGKMRNVCKACHGNTYMVGWARRYVLKRALQWREMKNARGHGTHSLVSVWCGAFVYSFRML